MEYSWCLFELAVEVEFVLNALGTVQHGVVNEQANLSIFPRNNARL